MALWAGCHVLPFQLPSPFGLSTSAQGKKGKTKMPSLVKKWQSIQRELDEEENSSSSEEDRETTAQRRIEEWKQQQLMRYRTGQGMGTLHCGVISGCSSRGHLKRVTDWFWLK